MDMEEDEDGKKKIDLEESVPDEAVRNTAKGYDSGKYLKQQ